MKPSTPTEQLDALLAELRANGQRAERLMRPLSGETLLQRPRQGAWSIAECVEHLNLTAQSYLPILDAALTTLGRVTQPADRTYSLDWMGRFMAWMVEPPYRTRVKTTQPFVPVEIVEPTQVLPRFLFLRGELAKRFEAGRGRGLDRVKVRSPFNARISYNLFACMVLITAHERRHLWQAEQVAAAALTETPGRARG
jgi:hypothetical protein